MTDATRPEPPPAIPPSRRGPLHILDAAGYSLSGARRLWQESAARLEIGGAALALVAFLVRGASGAEYLGLLGICCAVLVVEALNTAIEVLTDHVSPEWTVAAKQAKDLGSLAVALTLGLGLGYVVWVTMG